MSSLWILFSIVCVYNRRTYMWAYEHICVYTNIWACLVLMLGGVLSSGIWAYMCIYEHMCAYTSIYARLVNTTVWAFEYYSCIWAYMCVHEHICVCTSIYVRLVWTIRYDLLYIWTCICVYVRFGGGDSDNIRPIKVSHDPPSDQETTASPRGGRARVSFP